MSPVERGSPSLWTLSPPTDTAVVLRSNGPRSQKGVQAAEAIRQRAFFGPGDRPIWRDAVAAAVARNADSFVMCARTRKI
eukprot:670043-Pyramimonas_sp.AAC.2